MIPNSEPVNFCV